MVIMGKNKPMCGAETRSGGPCQRVVQRVGDRCFQHGGKPLSAKRIMTLCYKTIEIVAVVGGATATIAKIHPMVMDLVNSVAQYIMPEHFWYIGFDKMDPKIMRREIANAKGNQAVLEQRYSGYPPSAQKTLEKTYLKIQRILEEET